MTVTLIHKNKLNEIDGGKFIGFGQIFLLSAKYYGILLKRFHYSQFTPANWHIQATPCTLTVTWATPGISHLIVFTWNAWNTWSGFEAVNPALSPSHRLHRYSIFLNWAQQWDRWSGMLLLLSAMTSLGILGSSRMCSRNLSISNLNFSVLTLSMYFRYLGNEFCKRRWNIVTEFSWRDYDCFLFVEYSITPSVTCIGWFLSFILCHIVPSLSQT